MKTIDRSLLTAQLNWRYATKKFDPSRKLDPQDLAVLEDSLALTPSSLGLQPWSFLIVDNPLVREKLRTASYGQSQVTDASHFVVFTVKRDFGEADVEAHLRRMSEVRGVSMESLASFRGMAMGAVQSRDHAARQAWASQQVYIALGNLLTSAALLGIDACPMEGIDPSQYDEILGLKEKGLTALMVAALGYRADDDKYAGLPKVRFNTREVVHHV